LSDDAVLRKSARDCNGICIRYSETGTGMPIVFLHGFPDFSYSWRHQFPAMRTAGFRCLAPDLRGYNETDKPPHVRNYDIDHLVQDVDAFIDNIVGKSAHVAGHDWGGIIAWHLAARRPDRVRKLIILNAPHPATYRRELKRGGQLLRSWYVGAFQMPFLPELLLSSLHYRLLINGPARNDDEAEIYEEAFAQPRALSSALNYYRAAARRMVGRPRWSELPLITQPTLVLWGEKDRALSPRLLDGLEQHVQNLQVMRFPDVGHWVHIDAADRVNEELIGFLTVNPKI
jgi:pimeloyl-ACP methyl ester carboxylesterase